MYSSCCFWLSDFRGFLIYQQVEHFWMRDWPEQSCWFTASINNQEYQDDLPRAKDNLFQNSGVNNQHLINN